ncbi:MAG: J domain-containing protein [Elusimicrobiota bacterium]
MTAANSMTMSAKRAREVLGAGPLAGPAELRRAFREAAKRAHPDRKGGDAERFREVVEAYHILQTAPVPRDRVSQPPATVSRPVVSSPTLSVPPLIAMTGGKVEHRLSDGRRVKIELPANLALPRSMNSSFGVSNSQSKDKVDGSKRSSLSVSPSVSFPIRTGWTGQIWGAHSSVKNTSPTFPADAATLSANSEFTWARSARNTFTFGLGYNKNKDKVSSARSFSEGTLALRYSLSF